MIEAKINNISAIEHIPKPTISRLCKIYSLLNELNEKGETTISSNEIGKKIGVGSHNIRKDLSHLGETGTIGSGYEISKLKCHIEDKLGFDKKRKACIIGLGRLGMAILCDEKLFANNFSIIAGFDSNINKLETIKIEIPVYPSYEISRIIHEEKIELALLAIPGHAARSTVEKLVEGGIKGIVNFSPIVISSQNKNIHIRNIDLSYEFRLISALFTLSNE